MTRTSAILALLIAAAPAPAAEPCPVGHRGLMLDAPENTIAAFAACLELRIGFELDVRRSRDGQLVCIHDATVDRTTDGRGAVVDLTLVELKKLDAGRRFHPSFAGERVPTLDEAFALLARHPGADVIVAVDLKIDDATVEADMVEFAQRHRVLGRLVFIGRTIESSAVRRKLRAASALAPTSVLAQTAADLPGALADADAAWVYARFVPTAEQAAAVRRAGKRLFLSGPPVNGQMPENWKRARQIGADALLTDYPLECRRAWREPK